MKKTLTLLAFCLLSLNLTAQDSLRLTFKLEGFKAKDQLSIEYSEGRSLNLALKME